MSWRVAVSLAFVLALGCGDDDETPEQGHGHGPGHGHGHGRGHGHGEGVVAPREASLARVVRIAGGRTGPLRAGQNLDATATISTGVDEIILDLRDGARVELLPNSLARIGEEAPAQVFLARGHLHAILPPVGGSPRPPLRVGTPAVTVEIGGSGDVWVTARDDGTTWVAVLGGLIAVLPGRIGDDQREFRLRMGPGRSVVAGETLEEPTDGPHDATAARAMGEVLFEATAIDAGAALPAAVAELDTQIDRVVAEHARGEMLAERHRVAVSAMSADASEAMQEIVAHGRMLDAVRDVLLTRFERTRSLALLAGPEAGDPTALRRPRVRDALGLE